MVLMFRLVLLVVIVCVDMGSMVVVKVLLSVVCMNLWCENGIWGIRLLILGFNMNVFFDWVLLL